MGPTRRSGAAEPDDDVVDAEAELIDTRRRVATGSLDDRRVDRLLHVELVVREMWRALDRKEEVPGLDELYRAATGRHDDTTDRRDLIIAIAMASRVLDRPLDEPIYGPTNEQLATLVCLHLRSPARDRLRKLPDEVGRAVRVWCRGPGRPYKDAPCEMTKWEAIAALIGPAGIAPCTAVGLEKLWKVHGVIWTDDGPKPIRPKK